MYRISIGFLAIMSVLGADMSNSTKYVESVQAWQKHRDAGLRSEDGWLTLVGLFWLKPGANTIGSADSNDFVLPKTSPAHAGTLHFQSDKISFTDSHGVEKTLSYDDQNPTVIQAGSVS